MESKLSSKQWTVILTITIMLCICVYGWIYKSNVIDVSMKTATDTSIVPIPADTLKK